MSEKVVLVILRYICALKKKNNIYKAEFGLMTGKLVKVVYSKQIDICFEKKKVIIFRKWNMDIFMLG